jgi:hypothetical protein
VQLADTLYILGTQEEVRMNLGFPEQISSRRNASRILGEGRFLI